MNSQTENDPPGRCSAWLGRARNQLAILAPHQKERLTGQLLMEGVEHMSRLITALERIERGESAVAGLRHEFYGHAQRIAADALERPNDPKLSDRSPEPPPLPEAAQGEGADSARAKAEAESVTEPAKPEPGAETERQGCGSLQRMVRRRGFIRAESIFVGLFTGLLYFFLLTIYDEFKKGSVKGLVVGETNAPLAARAQEGRKTTGGDMALHVGVLEGIGATPASDLLYERFKLARSQEGDSGALHGSKCECRCPRCIPVQSLGDVSFGNGGKQCGSGSHPVEELIDCRANKDRR